MIIKRTSIPGCCVITPKTFIDQRGMFIKTYERKLFQKNNLATTFVDEFYTCSKKGVFRGFHFQTPPFDQIKLISCMQGEVMDVIVDLRIGSPKYGCHEVFKLSDENRNMLYLTPGIAHGFLTLTDNAIMYYKATSEYSPIHDSGIRWNSIGIKWPIDDLIISERDLQFTDMKEFISPFKYSNGSGMANG